MSMATTHSGRWRGEITDGVAVFRSVRYARALRFEPPRRLGPPDNPVGPVSIAPQTPSRMEAVMGAPETLPWSEDCLSVTVTVPADAEPGTLPVLVWLHGGAYLSGSGAWAWYGARRLVRETGIAVVAVNYRLGALGYLRAAGVSPGNLGLLDQITALEWVRDTIADFGGDPENVTVAGQSAGGQSIAALLGIPRTRSLFHRAILQSAPLGLSFPDRDRAERVGRAVLDRLDGDPRTAPVEAVMRAQGAAVRTLAGPGGLNAAPPFLPIAGVDPLPDRETWRDEVRHRARALRVIIGHTEHEMAAFHGPHPVFAAVRRVPAVGRRIAAAVSNAMGRRVFEEPARLFADELTTAGAVVHRYRVEPLAPDAPFGACHCIDLPLLLGDADAWHDAPMLRGLPFDRVDTLGAPMRRAWGEFVRSGTADPLRWQPHTVGSRTAFPFP
ncbi:carboxylesterase family protein [Nocardia otitidiscaviarum]|uniref:carboxylesterase family protein n=1 Tax=Nocardia otitidiscaviarum TaxID=1823 RepID=UPI001E47851E|nr:carboxylesterase family protein [Nocardia otitidiscaviarum]